MFEIGRLCVKLAGRDAGLKCVIVDILDNNYVLIDGQTRRRKCNIKHLEPLKDVINITKNASNSEIVEALKKLNIDCWEKAEKTEKEKQEKQKTERPRKKKKIKEKFEKPKKEKKSPEKKQKQPNMKGKVQKEEKSEAEGKEETEQKEEKTEEKKKSKLKKKLE